MKQSDYDLQYDYKRPVNDSWAAKQAKKIRKVTTTDGLKQQVVRRLPIISWVSKYKLQLLYRDFLAGITVGIYNVPQAMSYSTLAGLPPVFGLYASFFPPLIYAIFGTATHTSIGVFSVTCLMVNKCIQHVHSLTHEPKIEATGHFADLTDIQIATSLCLLTGLIQLGMAVIRCDILMKFLSAPAISAITFSACFFGVVQQIPKLLGFKVPSRNHFWFNLAYEIYDLFNNIQNSNVATVIISTCSFGFLIPVKFFLEPRIPEHPRYGKYPFPKELILVIVTTLASYFLDLENNFNVKTLKNVPTGFATPAVPRTDIWKEIYGDAIGVAVVSYAVTISMGQIFSKKHKYTIDSNQELLGLGLVNIGSSFFSVFPTSASLSRTVINEESGAKTQLSGIISCLCILTVIFFLGPFLESLPSCVLAAIVLTAVYSLLMQCRDLPKLWKCSKHDFWVWILTAAVTLSTDIAEGVAAGIFFAIVTIAVQSQQPTIKSLGQIQENDFRPLNHYGAAKETSFRMIRFDAPLIFTNADKFENSVREAAVKTKMHRSASTESQENPDWTAIILDCHTWTYTDTMGIDAVKELDEYLKKHHILLLFANLKSSLRRQYENSGLLVQISQRQMYPSLQEAVDAAHELVKYQKSFFDDEKV